MLRREFVKSICFVSAAKVLGDNAARLKQEDKAIIMIWLGGGPPTIDMWDLKPGSKYGGPFSPINTSGDFQICEHLPELAKLGDSFSIVRTMSTREADHMRGSYYMHTGFKPSPTVIHPSIGSTAAFELGKERTDLEIPPFFSIGTGSFGGGFLGTEYNPFVVDSNGRVNNLGTSLDNRRISLLSEIERAFIDSGRGDMPEDHRKLYEKTIRLNTSSQMDALKINEEPSGITNAYGNSAFGRSALMARRLVQRGVPFVEVGFGGWDLHQTTHDTLKNKLPELDKVVSSLIHDLKRVDLWDRVSIIMMGEFGRTPRINQDAGRDHWAKTWSAFISGGLMLNGTTFGETNGDGTEISDGIAFGAEDLIATALKSSGIDIDKNYTSKRGRPIKIANGGRVIYKIENQ